MTEEYKVKIALDVFDTFAKKWFEIQKKNLMVTLRSSLFVNMNTLVVFWKFNIKLALKIESARLTIIENNIVEGICKEVLGDNNFIGDKFRVLHNASPLIRREKYGFTTIKTGLLSYFRSKEVDYLNDDIDEFIKEPARLRCNS